MGLEYAKDQTVLELTRKARKSPMSDEDASRIVKSMLEGLRHIHRNNYIHRDLKPSIVVVADKNGLSKIKLVDLGLAVKYHTTQVMDETCGTLVYQAPE